MKKLTEKNWWTGPDIGEQGQKILYNWGGDKSRTLTIKKDGSRGQKLRQWKLRILMEKKNIWIGWGTDGTSYGRDGRQIITNVNQAYRYYSLFVDSLRNHVDNCKMPLHFLMVF